jgi:hypothetical protein
VFSTAARDRGGDVVEIGGIVTTEHRLNPVVLLDHGMSYAPPIGMNEDPNGNYAVSLDTDSGEATQTTYFSQKTDMAYQVYHLICEGIMRANSFGYRLLRFKRLPMDPSKGMTTSNKLIQSCELVETTWCGVPMNAECVMPVLAKGMIEGRKLAPCIKSMLSAWAPPRKVWSNGFGKGKAMTQSSLDETTGGALRNGKQKHMDQLEAPMPTEVKDADGAVNTADDINPVDDVANNKPRESHNCTMMRQLHIDLGNFHKLYDADNQINDHPEGKAHVQQILDSMKEHHGRNADLFAKTYAEAAPLSDDPDETEDMPASGRAEGEEEEEGEGSRIQDDGESGGKVSDEPEGEDTQQGKKPKIGIGDKKAFGTKSMSKSEMQSLKEIKDFLEEMQGEDNHRSTVKLGAKHCVNQIKSILAKNQQVGRVVADPPDTIVPKPKNTIIKSNGKKAADDVVTPEDNAEINKNFHKALAMNRALDRKFEVMGINPDEIEVGSN